MIVCLESLIFLDSRVVSESGMEQHSLLIMELSHSVFDNFSLLSDADSFEVVEGETKVLVDLVSMLPWQFSELL